MTLRTDSERAELIEHLQAQPWEKIVAHCNAVLQSVIAEAEASKAAIVAEALSTAAVDGGAWTVIDAREAARYELAVSAA